ncbi:hypothetical protein QR680_012995 [Steinernema hermaphroditum]|uniref:Apple domain-containing protein n=1 Tax=Steinernema hermaphroditum TaxID=289476 RepID=A0AA39I6V1_9BILA|nr:hypothetical protein QR680_012995 [Steinernema hermaphroditum]
MNSGLLLVFSLLATIHATTLQNQPRKRDVFDLNQCFTYRKGFRIELKAGDIESTDTVQFKDDCLKACLRALLNDGFECRSLMHMPRENDCVLTTVEGNSTNIVPLSEEKSAAPINYYENECAKLPLPGGGVVEAKLQGYRGQGLVQMVQKRGTNPQIMVILNGVPENNNFDIVYVAEEVKDCYKLSAQQKMSAQTLVTVDSDANGMGVQPWTEIFFDIFDDSVLGRTVVVIDAKTKQVFDCGKVQIRGNAADFEKAKNGVSRGFLKSVALFGLAPLLSIVF